MTRKKGKEIALSIKSGTISADEVHEWLAEATAKELSEYLREIPIQGPWAEHGRDALNVVLANENIKLQKEIRDLTTRMQKTTTVVTVLTVVIVFLTFIQAYPVIKTFLNCSKTSVNIQQLEKRQKNQTTETNQIKTKNDDSLNKSKILNQKETPNK